MSQAYHAGSNLFARECLIIRILYRSDRIFSILTGQRHRRGSYRTRAGRGQKRKTKLIQGGSEKEEHKTPKRDDDQTRRELRGTKFRAKQHNILVRANHHSGAGPGVHSVPSGLRRAKKIEDRSDFVS